MGTADRLHSRLEETEVPELPGLDQLLHRPGDILDRHLGIDAMLIEEVDGLDPEPVQGSLDALSDVVGPADDELLALRAHLDAELGRDHRLITEGSERLPDQLLVRLGPVGLGRVEEGDAAFDRRPDRTCWSRAHVAMARLAGC